MVLLWLLWIHSLRLISGVNGAAIGESQANDVNGNKTTAKPTQIQENNKGKFVLEFPWNSKTRILYEKVLIFCKKSLRRGGGRGTEDRRGKEGKEWRRHD